MKKSKNDKTQRFGNPLPIIGCCFLVIGLFFAGAFSVYAESSETREALETTKEDVDRLIITKDEEGSVRDLAYRIKTFKSVIDLSISEAKDMRLSLLYSDELINLGLENEAVSLWKENKLTSINKALDYFAQKREGLIQEEDDLTLEKIQELAINFRTWREENYLPVHEEINGMLLILKEELILSTAKKRWQKIENDLKSLEKAGVIDSSSPLWTMLQSSNLLIKEGEESNKKAFDLFFELYINEKEEVDPDDVPLEVETPESPEPTSTTTEDLSEEQMGSLEVTTEEQPDSSEKMSIRDLVRSSLTNVREAYGVFIEMSNFVRELLI